MTTAPELDVAALAAATDQLLATVADLDGASMRTSSLLPGWTVGHVLTHLARNADAVRRLITWAATGEPTPMYASPADREAAIERGATRGSRDIAADVRTSSDLLGAACEGLLGFDTTQLERLVFLGPARPGAEPDLPAYDVPWARLREVEIHHVDLGLAAYTPLDWPDEFVERMLLWVHGREGPVDVLGHPAEVLAWRIGRGTGPTVRRRDGSAPGAPPPW